MSRGLWSSCALRPDMGSGVGDAVTPFAEVCHGEVASRWRNRPSRTSEGSVGRVIAEADGKSANGCEGREEVTDAADAARDVALLLLLLDLLMVAARRGRLALPMRLVFESAWGASVFAGVADRLCVSRPICLLGDSLGAAGMCTPMNRVLTGRPRRVSWPTRSGVARESAISMIVRSSR